MKKTMLYSLLALLTMTQTVFNQAVATSIQWIDVSSIPGNTNLVINDDILGKIEISTDVQAQATDSWTAGSFGEYGWSSLNYIHHDGSTNGTNSPIAGSFTFNFLDGPIDTAKTPVFFSSMGLAQESSFIIDNNPDFIGEIGIAEGHADHTALDNGKMEITGAGFNHNYDLYRFDTDFISTITIDLDLVIGDGTGFTIGAGILPEIAPEPSPVPLPAAFWLFISGIGALARLRK